jgi:hypothetical protein
MVEDPFIDSIFAIVCCLFCCGLCNGPPPPDPPPVIVAIPMKKVIIKDNYNYYNQSTIPNISHLTKDKE